MKLLFLLFITFFIGCAVYIFLSLIKHNKKDSTSRKPILISVGVVIALLLLIAVGMYKSSLQDDIQCSSTHTTTTNPPLTLSTATDYFTQGDYDYERGNCQKAISDYSKSIALNPNYPEAYNNRAYTYMRLRDYKDALADLDQAIKLNPNYTQALMNRADIHNYYYQIDRHSAIEDYRKVIVIEGQSGGNNSVCGHLFLAEHNGWNLSTYIDFFRGGFRSCN